MRRVAFDFGRTSHIAFDQHSGGESAHRRCGREETRLACNPPARSINVGNDLFLWLAAARTHAREGQRSRHEFQKFAAVNVQVRCKPRKPLGDVIAKHFCVPDFVKGAPEPAAVIRSGRRIDWFPLQTCS